MELGGLGDRPWGRGRQRPYPDDGRDGMFGQVGQKRASAGGRVIGCGGAGIGGHPDTARSFETVDDERLERPGHCQVDRLARSLCQPQHGRPGKRHHVERSLHRPAINQVLQSQPIMAAKAVLFDQPDDAKALHQGEGRGLGKMDTACDGAQLQAGRRCCRQHVQDARHARHRLDPRRPQPIEPARTVDQIKRAFDHHEPVICLPEHMVF